MDKTNGAAEAAEERDTQAEIRRLREEAEAARQEAAADRRRLKERLYRELLRETGVAEKRMDAILRVTDLDAVGMKDGRLTERAGLAAEIRREWADFIGVCKTRGAQVETPPETRGPSLTRAEIAAIRDGSERRRAIAENAALFGLDTMD